MEIEHINDDTIRVRIENSDLEARGYTFLDLLGNQKHIESFFYSILEEVDIDEEFQESDAVTFQVMPSRDGLELFISKNIDVDDNFLSNDDFSSFDDKVEQTDVNFNQFESKHKPYSKEFDKDTYMSNAMDMDLVIEFQFFEQIIQLSRAFQSESGLSTLYKFDGKYYIEFSFLKDDFSLKTPREEAAMVLEYGEKSNTTSDILSEHGKLLIEDVALETIDYYFNK